MKFIRIVVCRSCDRNIDAGYPYYSAASRSARVYILTHYRVSESREPFGQGMSAFSKQSRHLVGRHGHQSISIDLKAKMG